MAQKTVANFAELKAAVEDAETADIPVNAFAVPKRSATVLPAEVTKARFGI